VDEVKSHHLVALWYGAIRFARVFCIRNETAVANLCREIGAPRLEESRERLYATLQHLFIMEGPIEALKLLDWQNLLPMEFEYFKLKFLSLIPHAMVPGADDVFFGPATYFLLSNYIWSEILIRVSTARSNGQTFSDVFPVEELPSKELRGAIRMCMRLWTHNRGFATVN
jgi:hypothetical protein